MAKQTGAKSITFESQLAKMNELFGIPETDSLNVFSSYKKTVTAMLGEEADAGTKQIVMETPFGEFGLNWNDAEERINSADGVAYTAPAHYSGEFGFPRWVVEAANKNVDFSTVPNASEIAGSKAA